MQFDAIRIVQPSGRAVYSFAATAEAIVKMTEVPRIGRDIENNLVGYQRPEVASHIAEIRKYLESEGAVLPNTIVLALTEEVSFIPNVNNDTAVQTGTLHFPDQPQEKRGRIGFVVDGQQRLAAIASCRHTAFPFFVTAFITPSVEEQRKQFVLVNRTKPLPQGMIFELLPEIDGCLPNYLVKQRQAAILTSRLNLNPKSSLYRKIKTPTCPLGFIKDNSIRRAVLNSLSDGALFELTQLATSDSEALDAMTMQLSDFWSGVQMAFPTAWDLPPKSSRLTHGVGIVALGYLMDHIHARKPATRPWDDKYVHEALSVVSPFCAWTEGTWQFSKAEERPWNALQNTDRDVRILAHYLQRVYDSHIRE